jgi:hypothetical protein
MLTSQRKVMGWKMLKKISDGDKKCLLTSASAEDNPSAYEWRVGAAEAHEDVATALATTPWKKKFAHEDRDMVDAEVVGTPAHFGIISKVNGTPV